MRRLFILALVAGCAHPARENSRDQDGGGRDPRTGWILHQAANPKPNAAYKWMMIMQEASGRSVDRVGARPTIISRETAVVMTARARPDSPATGCGSRPTSRAATTTRSTRT